VEGPAVSSPGICTASLVGYPKAKGPGKRPGLSTEQKIYCESE
jgi:hypothetical protein